jgi:hypothetical protein
MCGSSYIQARPNGYYLRIRVPPHLRPVLGREIIRSLQHSTPKVWALWELL